MYLKFLNFNLQFQSGGHFSAEDADSLPTADAKKKREGAFCVWSWNEIQNILGKISVQQFVSDKKSAQRP